MLEDRLIIKRRCCMQQSSMRTAIRKTGKEVPGSGGSLRIVASCAYGRDIRNPDVACRYSTQITLFSSKVSTLTKRVRRPSSTFEVPFHSDVQSTFTRCEGYRDRFGTNHQSAIDPTRLGSISLLLVVGISLIHLSSLCISH
jgi:hypothetical protein